MTIKFNNTIAVSLYNNEISGQLSDGLYENYNRGNKNWWGYVELGDKNDAGYAGHFNYSLDRIRRELTEICLGNRMYAYIMIADKYCEYSAKVKNCCDPRWVAYGAETIVAIFDDCYEKSATKDYEETVRATLNEIEKIRLGDNDFDKKALNIVISQYKSAEEAVRFLIPANCVDEKARNKLIKNAFNIVKTCIKEAEAA